MSVSQSSDLKKPSGGRKRRYCDKKKAELGSLPTMTKIGKTEKKLDRGIGGRIKVRLMTSETANVLDPKTNTYKVVKLRTEKENAANRNYARMNVLTRGAVVDTELGLVRILSRPGQDGVVNAVLLEKAEKK
jgi:small subunit ribosomal protein S8e